MKFSDIYIFSAGIKSNSLPYFALWSSILLSLFFILFPPYLEYIAFSLISTPLSSIATIFLIVTYPERNNKILFTKLVQANVAGASQRKKEI